jgi:hypothetical protein
MISPFVRKTGQTWKVVFGWTVIAAGLAIIYGCLNGWFGSQSSETFALVVLCANLANVGAFVWMVQSIRCPRCRLRLFWHALSSKEHPSGLRWFSSFEECPSCRYQPTQGIDTTAPRHGMPLGE